MSELNASPASETASLIEQEIEDNSSKYLEKVSVPNGSPTSENAPGPEVQLAENTKYIKDPGQDSVKPAAEDIEAQAARNEKTGVIKSILPRCLRREWIFVVIILVICLIFALTIVALVVVDKMFQSSK